MNRVGKDWPKLKVGMIQSNYLPWRGYFDFIADCDLFVIYDDVQYTRKDWRNRNQIKTADGIKWLTVPVLFSRESPSLIENSEILYERDWVKEHIGTLTNAYRRAPYFEALGPRLFSILREKHRTISALNEALIRWAMGILGIRTPIRRSSELPSQGVRTERIVDLLLKMRATDYLLGPAAKSYIQEDLFRAAGLGLEYKAYQYPGYPQLHGEFHPALSIVDVIFNCGPDAIRYCRSTAESERAVPPSV